MPDANQLPWIVVQNTDTDFPTQEAFQTDPHMYLVISSTGKTIVAEPEYYQNQFMSWWSPTGSIHVFPDETLMYLPVNIPADIKDRLMADKKARNSRLCKIMSGRG